MFFLFERDGSTSPEQVKQDEEREGTAQEPLDDDKVAPVVDDTDSKEDLAK